MIPGVSLLDLVIAALVALAAWLGWSRGLIRPLLSQILVIGTLLLIYGRGDLVGAVLPAGVPRPVASLVLLTLAGSLAARLGFTLSRAAYRLPFARRADRWLGVIANTAFALVGVYVLLVGLVGLDSIAAPLHGKATMAPTDVATVRKNVDANPPSTAVVDPSGLERLQEDALTAPVPIERLGDYEPSLGAYETKLRPQLLGSLLAPAFIQAGAGLPIVGRNVPFPPAR